MKTPDRSRLARLAVGAAASVLLIGLGSCSSDSSKPEAGADSSTTTAAAVDTTAAAGDLIAYCDASMALDQTFQSVDPDDEAAFAAALNEAAPVVDDLVANAPAELADQAQVMSNAFSEVVESGDPTPFRSPEVEAAADEAHAFDLENCDLTKVDIVAEDYHFTGTFPTEPGRVSIEMVNEGSEPHLMIVARKKDEVAGTAQEAFDAIEGEEDFPENFDTLVTVFASSGDSEYGLGELTAGEYVAFCPIPVGSGGDGEGDGPPHFVQGMVETFTVA